MINYLKSCAYTLGIILIGTIIITIFNYFNIINGSFLKVLELLLPIVSVFVGSYLLGKTSNKKGYIEGLKYALIWIILFAFINLIMKNFSYTSIIYYVILILISMLAGIVGINRKKR